ncbi:MAG: hypothetical protein DMG39_11410 [Acidobacteria bacterium]|nr:MAG: hypothetical protein DMG39_11410 [Acidobacteriota bacterium]
MRFSKSKLPLRSLIVLLLSLFFFTSSSSSFITKELRIESFAAEIIVSPNGSVEVTENIRVHFSGGPWRGLYRTVPVEYVTPQGINYALFLRVKSITDASGNSLKFESSRVRHYRKLKIYVPNADNSTQTISIEYTVSDALRFFEDHDELYWNVTGDEWDVPTPASFFRKTPRIFAQTSLPVPTSRPLTTRTWKSPPMASNFVPANRSAITKA